MSYAESESSMSRPVVTRTVVADEPLAVSWTSVPVLFVGAEINAIPATSTVV